MKEAALGMRIIPIDWRNRTERMAPTG